ncbi:hypothetical protein [Nonomuraea sp. CA-141351]|uniref:hypothetical protein n=1 Tax=Nonomuraea sp. CA-141351 TaxID=3239996 RepID=UPI003D8B639C
MTGRVARQCRILATGVAEHVEAAEPLERLCAQVATVRDHDDIDATASVNLSTAATVFGGGCA